MMLRYISRPIILSFLLVFALFTAKGQDFPETPSSMVSDYTGTLSRDEVAALERKLLAFEDSTSTQIAVVLIQSAHGYDIKDYAVRLANKWGVGQKKYNNGIMLLAALGDREATIQTGYGIEGSVPDAIAYRIIDNDIKPNFRKQHYYQGLDEATSSLIAYTKGEYKGTPREKKDSGGSGGGGLVVIVIIFIIIALISKGGGKNGGGRVMGGKGSNDLFWWILLNGMGGGRSGGGSGGGFGGDSGGGFGGFGGGGFGGGGASGRW